MKNSRLDGFFNRAKIWKAESEALREVLTSCDLEEVLKWRLPCYTAAGGNIAIIQPMKPHLSLMFFKGALIKDTDKILQEQGKNSRSARRILFKSVQDVRDLDAVIRKYVERAVDIQESGLEVEKPVGLDLVQELADALDTDEELQLAFEGLTPGRQRAYNILISQAKQSCTRVRRLEKYREKILLGKGPRD